MLGSLLEPLLATGHRPHLTRQADFPEHQQAMGQRPIAQAGHDRGEQRQVRSRFQHFHTAHHVQEHILIVSRDAPVPVQDGQQHGQTVLIQTQSDTARVGQVAVIDQCLDLDQHRPGAFPSSHHDAARDLFLGAIEKDRRGVGDFFQAPVGHAEHTQFVDRAEAVLHRAQ